MYLFAGPVDFGCSWSSKPTIFSVICLLIGIEKDTQNMDISGRGPMLKRHTVLQEDPPHSPPLNSEHVHFFDVKV